MLLLAACNFQQMGPGEYSRQTEVRATELELHVQQTLLAQQATAQGPAQTRHAAQATQAAQQPASPVPAASTITSTPGGAIASRPTPAQTDLPATPTETLAALDDESLRQRMQSANILLFEDIVARTNTNRYVKDTLTRIDMPFKDDGNAIGWLVDDLKTGASGGQPWDLVILALEDKVRGQSGFFNYALQALDSGASVILETWFISSTYAAGAREFLDRCGVEYQGDRLKIPPANMQMYPLALDHPLLNQPNRGLTF